MKKNAENSETYLKSVLKKDPGFTVPKDYFDTLENQFYIKSLEKEFSNNNSFATPDSYFTNLEDRIISKVILEEKPVTIISFRQRTIKMIPVTVAASIILCICLAYFNSLNTNTTFNELSQNDIEIWILENYDTMTSEEIASFITADDISAENFNDINLESEAIEDYIIYNENSNLLEEIN